MTKKAPSKKLKLKKKSVRKLDANQLGKVQGGTLWRSIGCDSDDGSGPVDTDVDNDPTAGSIIPGQGRRNHNQGLGR